MPNPRKPRANCRVCGGETARAGYTYCSNTCQQKFEYQTYIQEWKTGVITGLSKTGLVSVTVKKYLRLKYGNACCVCGWCEVNQFTGIVPLIVDHIDGNWRNNTEANLRLICPNCDSLSPTFAALNKGKGRPGRAVSKRVIEAREIVLAKKT